MTKMAMIAGLLLVEPLGAKRFAGRLREQGVTETSVRKGVSVVNGWRGVRLATDAERSAAAAWGEARAVGSRGL